MLFSEHADAVVSCMLMLFSEHADAVVSCVLMLFSEHELDKYYYLNIR